MRALKCKPGKCNEVTWHGRKESLARYKPVRWIRASRAIPRLHYCAYDRMIHILNLK